MISEISPLTPDSADPGFIRECVNAQNATAVREQGGCPMYCAAAAAHHRSRDIAGGEATWSHWPRGAIGRDERAGHWTR